MRSTIAREDPNQVESVLRKDASQAGGIKVSQIEDVANKTGTQFGQLQHVNNLNMDFRIKKQETMQEHYMGASDSPVNSKETKGDVS